MPAINILPDKKKSLQIFRKSARADKEEHGRRAPTPRQRFFIRKQAGKAGCFTLRRPLPVNGYDRFD
jgi:hypothetical protein